MSEKCYSDYEGRDCMSECKVALYERKGGQN